MQLTIAELRANTERVDPAELAALWDKLSTVTVEEVLGQWQAVMFPTGHRSIPMMNGVRWYGKRLLSPTNAQPVVCIDDDGELYSDTTLSNGGEASLWMIEYRGELTASMVYDALPLVDHFKRIGENTLLGVMNGKPELVEDDGHLLYFLMERA